MRTSTAALKLEFTEPSIMAAKAVAWAIAQNGSLQRDTLLWAMEQAYGGSSADGRWSLRDAYDMLELAQVFHLERAILSPDSAHCLAELVELVANLPTGARSRSSSSNSRRRRRLPIRTNPGIFARLRSFAANMLRFNQIRSVRQDRYAAALGGYQALTKLRFS